jgi:hypothetical protein
MKILIFFILTISLFAQSDTSNQTSLNLPLVEISAIVHSVISGFTISYMMKDRSAYGRGDPIYREYQKRWRLLLPFEYLSAVGVGVCVQLENNNKKWYHYLTDIAVAGMIRVNFRQWVYQIDGGRHWLNQPNSSWTFFPSIEKAAGAWIKIGVLAGVLAFKYFILPLID